MQRLIKDKQGVVRFRENAIVRALLNVASRHGFGLNEIAMGDYAQEDREQLAQLIGYSIAGYHELSYVSDASAKEADDAAFAQFNQHPGCRAYNCEIHCGVACENPKGD